jgi:NAD(P)-dependent dehydrogenase (short-subunit alcohol dehydrogenase family)
MTDRMKSVVVTGVSTGIGLGTAKVLTGAGYRVFGSVRRTADANRVAEELGPSFTPLLFDVTDEAAVAAAARAVRTALEGETLAGLVNNAGVVVAGPLLEISIEEFRQQIEINLVGQMIVTRAFAPLLGVDAALKGAPGRIVMISSVAGKRASPFVGPYAASKHGLEGLSASLRRELMVFGIDVIVIGPGVVRTPIWDKADAVDITRYQDTPYSEPLQRVRAFVADMAKAGLPAERVGELVLKALTHRRPRTRYTIVPDPIMNFITGLLPARVLDREIARRTGLTRKRG